MIRALATILILCAGPASAEESTFALPIDCTLGETCFIQNYMDRDPGPGSQDFTCGPLSYDGHKGTDFALLSMAQMVIGVDVRPALHGRVKAVRDGMDDVPFETGTDLDGRDCGNGVLVEHADGWTTQYCHMKNGSIRVGEGEPVFETTLLGQVGLSGRTQFPHLHLTLRQNGTEVDPFSPETAPTCTTDTAIGMWRDALNYVPGGLITSGFSAAVPDYADIKAGTAATEEIDPTDGALVIWTYVFGGQAGDVINFEYTGARGLTFSGSATLEKTQAQLFRAAGKRRRAPWPSGPLTGTVRLIRDGIEIDTQTITAQIR